jgi:hypothetical protein
MKLFGNAFELLFNCPKVQLLLLNLLDVVVEVGVLDASRL